MWPWADHLSSGLQASLAVWGRGRLTGCSHRLPSPDHWLFAHHQCILSCIPVSYHQLLWYWHKNYLHFQSLLPLRLMNSRSCCPSCKVVQCFVYSHFFFLAPGGRGELPHLVVSGSVLGHILSQFSTYSYCSPLPFSERREVVLHWVVKKREGNVTDIEVVLHVGHFLFIG